MIIGVDASRAASTERTGTELYSLRLIESLISLIEETRERDKPRLRLYTPRPIEGMRGLEDAVRGGHVEVCLLPFPRLWTHLRLSWELIRNPPGVLFVPAHVLPIALPALCRVPGVVTVHDLGYHHFPGTHRPLDRMYLEWSTRRHVRVAAHVIADSAATRDDLVEYYGADADRITVVYPAMPSADESPGRVTDGARIASARERYGIRESYFLYVGTLHPRKNLPRLVEAFGAARVSMPGGARVQLVIAGKKGWLYDEIFEKVRSHGLAEEVVFTGYVPEDEKAALLGGAVAFVYPSLYEGFGLPVLEAMACGTPVVCSVTSSLPEVAGDAALLVDPLDVGGMAEALRRVASDDALRAELVRRGAEQVGRFSWRRAAQEVLELLERVGGNKSE